MKSLLSARPFIGFAAAAFFAVGQTAPSAQAQPPDKPKPDAQFGNVQYKTPDPAQWTRHMEAGRLVFSTRLSPPDFCTLTVFPGSVVQGEFRQTFDAAVARELKRIEAGKVQRDSGDTESKAAEGFPVLQRTVVCGTKETKVTVHWFLAGNPGNRFDIVAFQTSGEELYNRRGADAVTFLTSVKLASSLAPPVAPAAPRPGGSLIGHWIYASGLTNADGRSYNSEVSGDLQIGSDGKFSDSRRVGRITANTSGTFTVSGDQLTLIMGKERVVWRFRITPGKDTSGKVFDNLLLYTDAKDLSYGLTRKTD